jgi:hypothetical protein
MQNKWHGIKCEREGDELLGIKCEREGECICFSDAWTNSLVLRFCRPSTHFVCSALPIAKCVLPSVLHIAHCTLRIAHCALRIGVLL